MREIDTKTGKPWEPAYTRRTGLDTYLKDPEGFVNRFHEEHGLGDAEHGLDIIYVLLATVTDLRKEVDALKAAQAATTKLD